MIGLQAYILPLTWPLGLKPLELRDFETQARRLRYQALGAACRDLGLPVLLTAHHSDDVAETLLMRLAASHTGVGLSGIKYSGPIPECWGMYGVHASGQVETTESLPENLSRSMEDQSFSCVDSFKNKHHDLNLRPSIEQGGIDVLRPLLTYSKDNLIRTCQAASVSWEEDETNKDPQRTPRNAIRSLLSSGKLPLALSKASILALAKRCQKKSYILHWISQRVEYYPHVINFDTRSGVLIVRMVKDVSSRLPGDLCPAVVSKQQIAVKILEITISSVTPLESLKTKNLINAANIVFGDIKHSSSIEISRSTSFTAGGVAFHQVYSPIAEYSTQGSGGISQGGLKQELLDPHYTWILSRQPFMGQLPTLEVPAFAGSPESQSSPMENWTSWKLWDGRYWIRIKNLSSCPLLVRPLLPPDLRAIKKMAPKEVWWSLKDALASIAPGKVRWTLPAIVQPAADESLSDTILALPSLGVSHRFNGLRKGNIKHLDWEIRYKMTSLKS